MNKETLERAKTIEKDLAYLRGKAEKLSKTDPKERDYYIAGTDVSRSELRNRVEGLGAYLEATAYTVRAMIQAKIDKLEKELEEL